MPKKDRLYLNKLWILHCFIYFSYEVKAGRRTHYCLIENDFRKIDTVKQVSKFVLDIEEKETYTEKDGFGISRKIFQRNLKDLLEEKLIIRISTKDNRSNYYSITPFGICYLIKSEYFRDPDKILSKEQTRIFAILETFVSKHIAHNSELFDKNELDLTKFYDDVILNVADPYEIGDEMPYVLSNFDYDSQLQSLNFSFEIWGDSFMKIPLANFRFVDKDKNEFIEIGQKNTILISDDKFHQYVSRLVICLIVYFHFQIRTIHPTTKKILNNNEILNYKDLPEKISQILFIFNQYVVKIFNKHISNINSFTQLINQV